MQGQDTQKSNVVSLFAAREEAASQATTSDESATPPVKDESFREIMERNHKNAERLRKERQNANKSVLRSYRIKH